MKVEIGQFIKMHKNSDDVRKCAQLFSFLNEIIFLMVINVLRAQRIHEV